MAYFQAALMVVDPDKLTYEATSAAPQAYTNMRIDYFNKKIKLIAGSSGSGAFLVSEGGVTLKCVYSKLKEVWKTDATLIKFPFPMLPITDEQFELINGWDFEDTTTKQLIRTGGWALKTADGASTIESYAGIISLGTIADNSHQIYYTQAPMTTTAATGAVTNFALSGAINQAIKFYGASGAGSGDNSAYLKLFCREYGYSYASSTLTDIGVAALTYQCYRFPLTTSADLKAINSNPTTGAYAGVSVYWSAAPSSQTATSASPYNVHINQFGAASACTVQQIYEAVQYKLRKQNTAVDVDDNATAGYIKYGAVAPDLLRFVGDTLYTIYQNYGATGGVWVGNIATADKNSAYFYDNNNAQNYWPYLAALRINFGDNLITDTTSKFTVFFTSIGASAFGTQNAIIANDDLGTPMSYAVSAISNVATNKYADLGFSYDANIQGGRTAGTDAPITVVALGLGGAQYVKTTGTIAKSKANSVSLVASLERNYQNPA